MSSSPIYLVAMMSSFFKRWTVLLLCLMVWNGRTIAQTAVVSAPTMLWQKRTLNVGNGLLSNSVYALAEDAQGCLWVGTTKGLSRFDGHTFSHWYATEQTLQGMDSSRCTLPHTSVTRMIGDSGGRMWFGTERGIATFDQRTGTWQQYLTGKGYSRQQENIHVLLCDTQGTVWIATSLGLFCLYNGTKTLVQPFPELAQTEIGFLTMDKAGNIWVGSEYQGLFVIQPTFNHSQFQGYSVRQYGNFQGQLFYLHHSSTVDGVIVSRILSGNVMDYWYCTIRNTVPQPYQHPLLNGFKGELIFFTEQQENSWVFIQSSYDNSCRHGLYCVPTSESILGQPPVIAGYTGTWFQSHRTGYLYVGMSSEGIRILAPTDMYKIPTPAGQPVTALALDEQKYVWLGTERGVFRAPASMLSRTSSSSIWTSLPLVLNTPPDDGKNKSIGIANTSGNSNRQPVQARSRAPLSDIWKPLPLVMSPPRTNDAPLRVTNIPSVRVITPSLGGNVLIGTERGIWKYDENIQQIKPFEAFNRSFPEAFIKDIAVNRTQTAQRGDIWVAAAAPYGMLRLSVEGNVKMRYRVVPVQESGQESEGVSHSIFLKMFCDREGALWLGTLDGLNRWLPERNTWQQFLHDPNDTLTLAAPRVRPLLEDEAGNIIICSYGAGLSILNPLSLGIRQLTARQGLRKTNIFSVLPFRRADSGKEYWICIFENAEMALYDPRSGRMTEIAMPRETGMLTTDGATTNADATVQPHKSNVLRLPDGTYLADYRGGLIHIDPNRIALDTALPHIILSSWMKSDTLMPTLPRSGDTIRLPYNASVSFNAAVLEMLRPEACMSEVMLDGIDKAWKRGDASQNVRYTTLPDGTYTLRLRAGKDGVMSLEEYHLTLIVQQPMWKAWWFLLGIVVFGTSSVASVTWVAAQWQMRQKEIREHGKHQIEQLHRVAAEYRLKTLQMQMDPHFIHGTMTVLQNLILEGDTDRASDYVATFTKHMRSLLFNNNLTNIPLIEELNLVRGYIELEKTRFASVFSWEIIGVEDSPEWLQNGVPPFIMQPFVENAIRHGLRPLLQKPHEYARLAQLTIHVESLPSAKAVCCTIEDNGVGRVVAAQYEQKLSERGMNNNLSISTVSVTERLHLLEKMYGLPVNVEYEDVVESVEEYVVESAYNGNTLSSTAQPSLTQRVCGTRVKITIPFVNVPQ